MLTNIAIFHKFGPKLTFFENCNRYQDFIFSFFYQNRDFPKNLTHIYIFENFDQNRDDQKFSPKSIFYSPNQHFGKFRQTSIFF